MMKLEMPRMSYVKNPPDVVFSCELSHEECFAQNPSVTRSIQTMTNVERFALRAKLESNLLTIEIDRVKCKSQEEIYIKAIRNNLAVFQIMGENDRYTRKDYIELSEIFDKIQSRTKDGKAPIWELCDKVFKLQCHTLVYKQINYFHIFNRNCTAKYNQMMKDTLCVIARIDSITSDRKSDNSLLNLAKKVNKSDYDEENEFVNLRRHNMLLSTTNSSCADTDDSTW